MYESVSWTIQEATAANTIFLEEEEGIQEAAASLAAANKISMGARRGGHFSIGFISSQTLERV